MSVVYLTILCGLFYTAFEIFANLAGNKINSWLAAALYNGIGTVMPIVVYLAISAKGKTTGKGILFAGLAGIAIMGFSVLLARTFSLGGNLGFVIPTVYGIGIVLSSLFGWLILKDKVSGLQTVGLLFIIVGVVVVVIAKRRAA
jgi:bacterial/archaeal transporter family protein